MITAERIVPLDNDESLPASDLSYATAVQESRAFPVRHIGRPLTPRQASVLDFVSQHIDVHGCAPTLREIGMAFGIRSTNGVTDHLRALERKGYIARRDMLARGIRLVGRLPGQRPDPVAFITAENEALLSLLRRVSAAGLRAQSLTAEMVVVLGDVREVLRVGGKNESRR